MYTYRFTVSYDGTRYRGWQRQQNTEQTIQGIIERCLSKELGYKVYISGSGRTDSGVHAYAQEVSVVLRQKADKAALLEKLNIELPEDIRILCIQEVEDNFHARKSACGKCYIYYVDLREKADVFTRRYTYHFLKKVDIDRIRKAAGYLQGTHDFSSFTDLKDSDDTIRTIYKINVECDGNVMKLSFYGDGFLYHMVRILTGTLLDVGTGRIGPEQIPAILAAKDRAWSGFPAPARGLFLKKVYYKPEEMPDFKVSEEVKAEKFSIF